MSKRPRIKREVVPAASSRESATKPSTIRVEEYNNRLKEKPNLTNKNYGNKD